MIRFSCFNAPSHSHKPKKTVQPSVDKMHKTSRGISESQASKDLPNDTSINSVLLKAEGDMQIDKHFTSVSSITSGSQSGNIKSKFSIGTNRRASLKKSLSLGSGLFQEGRVSGSNDAGDETDLALSCEGFIDHKGLAEPGPSKDRELSPPDECGKGSTIGSFRLSPDTVNYKSIFSIGDPQHLEKEGHENSDSPLSGEGPGDSVDHTPRIPPVIVKSCSLPNLGAATPISGRCSPFRHVALLSRSAEDLHILDMRQGEFSLHKPEVQGKHEQVKRGVSNKAEENTYKNSVYDGYDSYNYSSSAKDWIVPLKDEVNPQKNLQGESSVNMGELPSKDFRIKRIVEWVNDLQPCCPLEETNEPSQTDDQMKSYPNILKSLTAGRVDGKVTPGMEAAKKYISSLSAIATTAQLANHGLVVIPFLSAFASLRVLNLSGNAIAKITAGALPRGLHVLNLSKNNISAIEGLRELTRLRVLDLSYNRIVRIGHGLASCSSLKELYLAGNKISEVEGLHRLLKLNVLDLRFNKISTTKCLGQLAANYSSLQAISLEGNPAQKNVGDEQLKKYLQGLLPHLTYFNRLPTKTGSSKDAMDRSVRLGISSHQLDRTVRSDHKSARKVHGLAANKPSSSSTHGRKSQAMVSPKQSKGSRHGLLPPVRTKATIDNRHSYFDFSNKLPNLPPDLSMRRSQSLGTLGAGDV